MAQKGMKCLREMISPPLLPQPNKGFCCGPVPLRFPDEQRCGGWGQWRPTLKCLSHRVWVINLYPSSWPSQEGPSQYDLHPSTQPRFPPCPPQSWVFGSPIQRDCHQSAGKWHKGCMRQSESTAVRFLRREQEGGTEKNRQTGGEKKAFWSSKCR